jgi:hypothetical protein
VKKTEERGKIIEAKKESTYGTYEKERKRENKTSGVIIRVL